MSKYWQRRKRDEYYAKAVMLLVKYVPAPATVLDVGGNVSGGCKYLDWLPAGYTCTSVEYAAGNEAIPGVTVYHEDFMSWEAPATYDAVMCLQVLEHVDDPWRFTRKLFSLAPRRIISVPYMWPEEQCEYHQHDPVDEIKLQTWTRYPPHHQYFVDKHPCRRLVGLY